MRRLTTIPAALPLALLLAACPGSLPSKADVPCEPGPYTLSLMRDATGDDPNKGVIEATCTP